MDKPQDADSAMQANLLLNNPLQHTQSMSQYANPEDGHQSTVDDTAVSHLNIAQLMQHDYSFNVNMLNSFPRQFSLGIPTNEHLMDQPLYVNPKQYHRIVKRRQQRAKIEREMKGLKQRKGYLHESRHKHAMRRERGKSGRFVSRDQEEKEEEKLKQGEMLGHNPMVDPKDDEDKHDDSEPLEDK